MLFKSKKVISGVLISGLITGMALQGTANAAAADRAKKGIEGSVTCGGAYYIRNGGTEIQRSTYVLRNVADVGTIYLDRVRVFSATGAILFDSDVSGIPASYNGVITPADNGLDPRQTANLRIADLIPTQGRTSRPLQTVVDWTADEPTLTLDAVNVRTNTDIDPVTGKIGTQRGRHSSACRTTKRKKHW